MTTLRELLDAVEHADEVHAQAAQAERVAREELEWHKTALQQVMVAQGTDIVRKDGFTITLKDKVRYGADDWDKFYTFLKRSGELQLLERRISSKAFEELLERRKGKEVPGVSQFTYQTLQTRRG